MTALRRLNSWQIVRLMKKKGLRQVDVAQRVGVSISFVHDTIQRRKPDDNEKANEVWAVLEEVLG